MALAFPPYDVSLLVWVALLPLLSALWTRPARFWRGFFLGWLFGMGWYCISFWWIHNVGHVFRIPTPLFLGVAFFPLMALYSCLPGLWAGVVNTWLRPRLSTSPATEGKTRSERLTQWKRWAVGDLLSTLRSACGAASLWVCVEWARAHGTLGFSWNSMGTALYDGLSFVQWAEFAGTAALSFIPVFTAVILWGASRRCYRFFKATASLCRPWDFYALVIALFALFTGGLALSKAYSPLVMFQRDSVMALPVMAVQINQNQTDRIEAAPGHTGIPLMRRYLDATKRGFEEVQKETFLLAQRHPGRAIIQQLPVWVVWPESAMPAPVWRDTDTGELLPSVLLSADFFGDNGLPGAREAARSMGGQNFVLFSGIDEFITNGRLSSSQKGRSMFNSMAVIPGDFSTVATASKQHLMPFGEYIPLAESVSWINETYTELTGTQVGDGIRPGTGDSPIETPVPGTKETIGVIPAVCYEDTVGDLLTKFVRKGPQVIVNVTNDAWFRNSACGEQQARAAAFRCIELRRPMVRAANQGTTCCIAPNGAFIHTLRNSSGDTHTEGYSYGLLPVDKNAGYTLYALAGDWAVAVCAVAAGLLCLGSLFSRKRLTKNTPCNDASQKR